MRRSVHRPSRRAPLRTGYLGKIYCWKLPGECPRKVYHIIRSMKSPIKVIIVGAGHRALIYASYAKEHPDELEIVGVADPAEVPRRKAVEMFGLRSDQCFDSAEELARQPKMADAVINGTMDHQHVPTTLPLLAAGYDVLLEKPLAPDEEEMWKLVEAARRYGRRVMICHVLRYAPFYVGIRRKIEEGAIGKVINIQTTEHVSYHHVAVSFVRGKHGSKKRCHTSMLLSKCCHDLDLIAWLKSETVPRAVGSFGGRMQFRPEMAPEGAGRRCLVDCPAEVESKCLYSARKHYIDHPDRWSFYVWQDLQHLDNPTLEQKIEALKREDNPYGQCVYHLDNDVVDHQSVAIQFEDGATATHNMIGGSAKGSRSIHVIGTTGEISGCLEDSKFTVRRIDPSPGNEFSEEEIDLNLSGDMHGAFGGHGGGDMRLVTDFVRTLQGEPRSISCTDLGDSIYGHLLCYTADRAMEEHRVVDLPDVSSKSGATAASR